MKALVAIASTYALFVSLFGFLFGQMFLADFSFSASIAGAMGALAGVSGLLMSLTNRAHTLALWSAIAGLFGLALNAGDYYSNLHASGNYYPWQMVGPLCLALLGIAYTGWSQRAQRKTGQDLTNGA